MAGYIIVVWNAMKILLCFLVGILLIHAGKHLAKLGESNRYLIIYRIVGVIAIVVGLLDIKPFVDTLRYLFP